MMQGYEVGASLGEGVSAPLALEEIEAAVRAVLAAEGVHSAELSVALVSDEEITRLNQDYLAHEGPTDVISFPLPGPDGHIVGDVYVGAEQARRQAEELGASLREELLRLAIHGTLHVLGYDHPEGVEREESPMYRRQEELLASVLGSGGPGAG